MTEKTRKQAQAKLASMVRLIGYPDKWKTYDFDSRPTTTPPTSSPLRKWEVAYDAAKIGKPYDRSEWMMTPQTTNAYYNPAGQPDGLPRRHPAAALLLRRTPAPRPTTAPSAWSWATSSPTALTIRARSSTPTATWPTGGSPPEPRSSPARGECVVDQYGSYEPLPGLKLNGKLTARREHRRHRRRQAGLPRLSRRPANADEDLRRRRLFRRSAVLPRRGPGLVLQGPARRSPASRAVDPIRHRSSASSAASTTRRCSPRPSTVSPSPTTHRPAKSGRNRHRPPAPGHRIGPAGWLGGCRRYSRPTRLSETPKIRSTAPDA